MNVKLLMCYVLMYGIFPVEICDFETDLCGWSQISNTVDDFDWTLGGGKTQSTGTGPSTDHTRGNSVGKCEVVLSFIV